MTMAAIMPIIIFLMVFLLLALITVLVVFLIKNVKPGDQKDEDLKTRVEKLEKEIEELKK